MGTVRTQPYSQNDQPTEETNRVAQPLPKTNLLTRDRSNGMVEIKYAVQYARPEFSGRQDVVEDTNPIDYDTAIELYKKHREDFIKCLERGEDAQLVVWKDVGDAEFPSYSEELVDLDTRDKLTVVGNRIYKNVPVKIEEPI